MSQLQPSESAPSVQSDGSINHDEKPHTRLLLSLPVELMVMTAQHLSKSDLCSFRISCKGVEDKTFRHFAAKYFSEKCFMPSSYGLRGLVAMSRSRLAPYIQTLGLGPATNEIGMSWWTIPRMNQADRSSRRWREYYAKIPFSHGSARTHGGRCHDTRCTSKSPPR